MRPRPASVMFTAMPAILPMWLQDRDHFDVGGRLYTPRHARATDWDRQNSAGPVHHRLLFGGRRGGRHRPARRAAWQAADGLPGRFDRRAPNGTGPLDGPVPFGPEPSRAAPAPR